MTILVLCNVGTRDVAVDDQFERNDVRGRGKELLDDFPAVQDRLSFPIIQPALEYTWRQEGRIDRLVFIGTNQKDESHRLRDTLYYADLAERAYGQRYGHERLGQAESRRVEEINPSLYDEAFRAYERLLGHYDSPEVTICYLLATGGVPACNTALLLQGVRLFGERCRVVYQSERGALWPLQVGQQVMAVMREGTATELLRRFDFAAAYQLLASTQVDGITLALLQYASCRLWFDFAAARRHLEEALALADSRSRQQLLAIRGELEKLEDEDEQERELALIGEVYHNALIAWNNGRYVDFLGRATRFQEAVLHYLVARLAQEGQLGSAVSARDLSTQPGLRGFLIENLERLGGNQARPELVVDEEKEQELRQILNEYFNLTELKDLCFDLRIDYENLPGETKQDKARELVDHARRHGLSNALIVTSRQRRPNAPWRNEPGLTARTTAALLPAVVPVLKRLESLVSLRYDSIIAHGFSGVSADIILQNYNQSSPDAGLNPVRDMTVVSSELGIATGNPFRIVRDLIIEQLR